jgi:arylsulfatase
MNHPNVLLICTDHWPGSLTRMAGHPSVMTPTLAQLARSGTWFPNAYTPCPSCIPARRSLMTGLTPKSHGDRVFNERLEMPDVPTLAQCYTEAGYQARAVGKLHVYPQKSTIGFDHVIHQEEGRHQFDGAPDDWEKFLAAEGFPGLEFAGGQGSNDYHVRPWHLPDYCHPTEWATREMCRTIHERDPDRPAFWYLGYIAPHPPLWPLQTYLDLYRDVHIDPPVIGDWAGDVETLPYALQVRSDQGGAITGALPHEIELARRAFYALCTHIDHQLRVVIGTLREEGILDDTVIAFTSDHGDMLGDHGFWAKTLMYEASANVPLLILPREGDERFGQGATDGRLAALQDIAPTLLDLAGLPVPDCMEGLSLAGGEKREFLYAEHWEGDIASRMVRDERYKLVYYPVGNVRQLFDLQEDRKETRDLSTSPEHSEIVNRLTKVLIGCLYGDDLNWVHDGDLEGLPDKPSPPSRSRGLGGQRGLRFL